MIQFYPSFEGFQDPYECNVEPQIPLPSFELKCLEALRLAGPEDHLQQRLLGIHHWTLMT